MTTVEAPCDTCGGYVHVDATDITLVVGPPRFSYYEFWCPDCNDLVHKPATDHIVTLLMSAGVTATVLDIPAEALEQHTGPALSYDDLLDFAIATAGFDDLAGAALSELATST